LHLGLHAPAAIFQEVVRATLATYYRELVTDLPVIRGARVQMPIGVSLRTSLRPEVKQRDDATIKMSGIPSGG
jgi:hypothetical protein